MKYKLLLALFISSITAINLSYDPEAGEWVNDKILEDRRYEAEMSAQIRAKKAADEAKERNDKKYANMMSLMDKFSHDSDPTEFKQVLNLKE